MVDFSFIIDNQGQRVYNDPQVQRAYINLGRLSDFVGNCQIKTELEYENICQNVEADGNTNTSSDFLINLLTGAFEFMGDIEFPWVGKTGGKIAGWILSALVDTWRSEPPQNLQQSYNNVWNGTKDFYDQTKITVDTWRQNLDPNNGPSLWVQQFKSPKDGSIVTISQLGDIDFLPDSNDPQFDQGAIAVANASKYLINKILVPTRWQFNHLDEDVWWNEYYKRWNDSHPWDGPYYDGLTAQVFFGVYTSFPDLDVVQAQTNANHYLYFSQESAEQFYHNWFTDDEKYDGTRYKKWSLTSKKNGGTAPDSFVSYLFTDGPGGDSQHGIASHDDVFNNWGLTKSSSTKPKEILDVYGNFLKRKKLKANESSGQILQAVIKQPNHKFMISVRKSMRPYDFSLENLAIKQKINIIKK